MRRAREEMGFVDSATEGEDGIVPKSAECSRKATSKKKAIKKGASKRRDERMKTRRLTIHQNPLIHHPSHGLLPSLELIPTLPFSLYATRTDPPDE